MKSLLSNFKENLSLVFFLTILFSCTEKELLEGPSGDVSTQNDSIYIAADSTGAFDYIAVSTNGYCAAVKQPTDSDFDLICVFDSIVPNENTSIIAYCDSTGKVSRVKTKESIYDIHYHSDDDGMDVLCVSGENVEWVRDIKNPYSQTLNSASTRAGNVLTPYSIGSVLTSIITGVNGITDVAGIANTVLGGNRILTGGLGLLGIGALALSGAGELALLIAGLKAILDTANASINDFQNAIAEFIYNNAHPLTGEYKAVGKQKVRLSCSVNSVSPYLEYQQFNVGIIIADGLFITKSYHLQKQSVKYNGQAEYSFVFEVEPHKRYKYRAILEPSFSTSKFQDTYLDYWRYGPVREFTLEDPEIVITEAKQVSVENNAGHNFIFTVSVKAECDAEVDRWGVALYRDFGGDELEAVRLAEEGAKNGTFQFTINVSSVMMNTDVLPYKPLAVYKVAPYIKLGNESFYYTDDYTVLDLQYGSGCPDDNHPHAIDLGLPSGTKWCCCNVGASTPEGYGGYYAWGETTTKSMYNWDTYAYGSSYWDNCQYIGSDIAGTGYDAATVNMGAPWRMPSTAQQQELINNCSRQWTQVNGVNGILVTGRNGGRVFLPAAGHSGWEVGSYADYWSSSLIPSDTDSYACDMSFRSGGDWYWNSYYRYDGQSVRAVCP